MCWRPSRNLSWHILEYSDKRLSHSPGPPPFSGKHRLSSTSSFHRRPSPHRVIPPSCRPCNPNQKANQKARRTRADVAGCNGPPSQGGPLLWSLSRASALCPPHSQITTRLSLTPLLRVQSQAQKRLRGQARHEVSRPLLLLPYFPSSPHLIIMLFLTHRQTRRLWRQMAIHLAHLRLAPSIGQIYQLAALDPLARSHSTPCWVASLH